MTSSFCLVCIRNIQINLAFSSLIRIFVRKKDMKKIFVTMLAVVLFAAVGHAGDGIEAVDLGLSVKWANMNVGAKKPSGYGTYFAWGETQAKEYYSWKTYAWSKGDSQFLTKYSSIDKRTKLASADDAATANLGGDWRMPTAEEFDELVNPDNCTWEWTSQDGVNGYKVTSKKTGNAIFLPITGFRYYADTQFRAISGVYWTSSLYTVNPNKAWCLEFNFSKVNVHYGDLSSNRFSGRCIRAVR